MLVTTALRLVREQGLDATTMRGTAREAGVPAGDASHDLAGRDELVQELYRVGQVEHRDRGPAGAARHAVFCPCSWGRRP